MWVTSGSYHMREIIWRGKILANFWQFAKFLPSKCLSFTIQIACKGKFANILPSKN